jgi:hypothetical protein
MPAPGPEHDKIRAQWVSNILSKNMLEKVRWCKHSEMESWSWTICWPMNCSNRRRHTQTGGGRKSHASLRCHWKGNVLLSTRVKASRRKGCWSTINLTTMIETTRAQPHNSLLGRWWMLIWAWHHQKLLRAKFVYELEVFLDYQKILDPKCVHTFGGKKNKMK